MYNYILNKKFDDIGVQLTDLGINEIAFRYEDVFKIIDWCRDNKYVILGGDVYKISDDIILLTGDSWYYNKQNIYDDVIQSNNKAINYIKSYSRRNDSNFLFSVVVSE